MKTDRKKGAILAANTPERASKTTVKDYPDKKVGHPEPNLRKR